MKTDFLCFCLLYALALCGAMHVSAAGAANGGSTPCGNAAPDPFEACDDGNTLDGDGCSANCRIEPGFACSAATAAGTDSPIPNGDFESPAATQNAWSLQSTNFGNPLCDVAQCGASGTSLPGAGSGWLWLGGALAQEAGSAEQSVIIDATDTVLRLSLAQPACDSATDTLTVSLDGNAVFSANGSDAACGTASYRPIEIDLVAAAGGPYNDGASHVLRIAARTFTTNGGETSFFIDDVAIPRNSVAPQPSVCSAIPNVCESQDFDPPLNGSFAAIGWTTFSAADSATGATWGTSDDAACHSANATAGNFTGGTGEAACVDSDAAGEGLTDTYLCSPPLVLTGQSASALRFLYSYQVFGLSDAHDSFSVLVGSAAPDAQSVGGYTPLLATDLSAGRLFDVPGAEANIDLSAFDGSTVHVCLRYGGDFDWSAQVDNVLLTASNCGVADSDRDGVPDSIDNCTRVANPAQIDSNGDGFGNLCDADIAGPAGIGADDCMVNIQDLGALRAAFGSTPADTNWNPHADFAGVNGGPDGQINAIDLGRLRLAFFEPPGPAAAECAK